MAVTAIHFIYYRCTHSKNGISLSPHVGVCLKSLSSEKFSVITVKDSTHCGGDIKIMVITRNRDHDLSMNETHMVTVLWFAV